MRVKTTSKIIFVRKNWNFDDSEYGGKKKIKIKKEKKRKENEMKRICRLKNYSNNHWIRKIIK